MSPVLSKLLLIDNLDSGQMWYINTMFRKSHAMRFITFSFLLAACTPKPERQQADANPIIGSWKLLTGTVIENGDTTVTDYTKNTSFIKIINATHFAFLNHDLARGKDSTAVYVSGGGRYSLTGDQYTEHLEYCTAREWEGNDFTFTVEVRGDTLVQKGVEKVEEAGVDRFNTEVYVRAR